MLRKQLILRYTRQLQNDLHQHTQTHTHLSYLFIRSWKCLTLHTNRIQYFPYYKISKKNPPFSRIERKSKPVYMWVESTQLKLRRHKPKKNWTRRNVMGNGVVDRFLHIYWSKRWIRIFFAIFQVIFVTLFRWDIHRNKPGRCFSVVILTSSSTNQGIAFRIKPLSLWLY